MAVRTGNKAYDRAHNGGSAAQVVKQDGASGKPTEGIAADIAARNRFQAPTDKWKKAAIAVVAAAVVAAFGISHVLTHPNTPQVSAPAPKPAP